MPRFRPYNAYVAPSTSAVTSNSLSIFWRKLYLKGISCNPNTLHHSSSLLLPKFPIAGKDMQIRKITNMTT